MALKKLKKAPPKAAHAAASKRATTSARSAAKKSAPARSGPKAASGPSRGAVPRELRGLAIEELERRGTVLFWEGRFDGSAKAYRALIDRLVKAGPPDDPDGESLQGEMEIRLAAALRRSGALKKARERVERAVSTAPRAPNVQAAAHVLLAELHLLAGNRPLAEVSAERAVEVLGANEPAVLAWAIGARARNLWAAGQFEDARQVFMEAQSLALRHGDEPNAIQLEGNVGMCLLELGRLADARNWVGRAAERAAAAYLPAIEAGWVAGLARIALAEGAHDEAAALAARALAMARALELPLIAFRAEWLAHYLATVSGAGTPDRARMADLRKLVPALKDFDGDREVVDLRALVSRRKAPESPVASFTEGCDPVPSLVGLAAS